MVIRFTWHINNWRFNNEANIIQNPMESDQIRPKSVGRIELEEEEKLVIALLQTNNNQMDLSALKVKSELSGKKWDAAMKGLSKHGLVKVVVSGELKTVELIG